MRVAAISVVTLACGGATEVNEPAPDVAAAEPVGIIKLSGDVQQGRPGERLHPIVVAVRDRLGRPVPGVRVRFSVKSGDGSVGLFVVPPSGNGFVARYRGPADGITDENGTATGFWWLGKHGENLVVAAVESDGERLEATFRATSVSSGYAGGTFSLRSAETSLKLYDGLAGGPYDCAMISGSLVLFADGSFQGATDFTCRFFSPESFDISVAEDGFYAVSDSTVVIHYLKSNDTIGFFDPRDVQGSMTGEAIVFSSYGAEWRYSRIDEGHSP